MEGSSSNGQASVRLYARRSVCQDWVHELTFMQQSVLLCALRGPDGIRKNHPVKVLCRWLRRCVLLSAFDRRALWNPYEGGGGSFTGQCRQRDTNLDDGADRAEVWVIRDVDHAFDLYLESVDELPHHFQLHFMHAAEILGYKFPDTHGQGMMLGEYRAPYSEVGDRIWMPDGKLTVKQWWLRTYLLLANDAHLRPEDEATLDKRLGDYDEHWREAEEVTAR